MFFAGRVAEELFVGTVTTGAQDDIERATNLAKQFVGVFGMCEEYGRASLSTSSGNYGSKLSISKDSRDVMHSK